MNKAVVIHADQIKDVKILHHIRNSLRKVCENIFLLCKAGPLDGFASIPYRGSFLDSINCPELHMFEIVFTIPYNVVFNYSIILNEYSNSKIIIDKALKITEGETHSFLKSKTLSIRDESNYQKIDVINCLAIKMNELNNERIFPDSSLLPLGVSLFEENNSSGIIVTNAASIFTGNNNVIKVNGYDMNSFTFFRENLSSEPLGILFFTYDVSLNSNIYSFIKDKKICVIFSNKMTTDNGIVIKPEVCLAGIYINKDFYVKNQLYCDDFLSGYRCYYTKLKETDDICYGYTFHEHDNISFIDRELKNTRDIFVDCSIVNYRKFFNICGILNTNVNLFVNSEDRSFDSHLKSFSNIRVFRGGENDGYYSLTSNDIKECELNPNYFNQKNTRNNTKIHCINFYTLNDECKKKNRRIVFDSVKKQINDSVKFINYGEEKIGNCFNVSTPNNDKCSAKVMLNICSMYSKNDNDLLIITNSDCTLMDGFYNLDYFQDDILFLYRADINSDIESGMYECTNKIHNTGIDGICIPKKYLKIIYDEMLDVTMGDPRWDNYMYHFLKSKFPKNCKEIVNLFHHEHERNVNNGKIRKNDILLKNISDSMSLEYNKIENYDMSIIVYPGNYDRRTIDAFFNVLKLQYGSYEVIMIEYSNIPKYRNLSSFISKTSKLHVKHIFLENNDLSYIDNVFNAFSHAEKYATSEKLLFLEPNFYIKDSIWLKKMADKIENSDDIVIPYDTVSNYDFVFLGFGLNRKVVNSFNYLRGLYTYNELISTYDSYSIKCVKQSNLANIIDITKFGRKFKKPTNFNFNGMSTENDIFCFSDCIDILKNEYISNKLFISNVRNCNINEIKFDDGIKVKVEDDNRLHLFLEAPITCDKCKIKFHINSGEPCKVYLYIANKLHIHLVDTISSDSCKEIYIDSITMKKINFNIENITIMSEGDYILKELKLYV